MTDGGEGGQMEGKSHVGQRAWEWQIPSSWHPGAGVVRVESVSYGECFDLSDKDGWRRGLGGPTVPPWGSMPPLAPPAPQPFNIIIIS